MVEDLGGVGFGVSRFWVQCVGLRGFWGGLWFTVYD